jgi:hypothetical protein
MTAWTTPLGAALDQLGVCLAVPILAIAAVLRWL